MKLIACYNVYNEAEYLEESFKSIRDKVDYIVVVDGAYKKFQHDKPYSTDGTIKIANKYADKVILNPIGVGLKEMSWESEVVKRNKYLMGKEGDCYLVIDGHEIWEGELKPPFGDYRIKMIMKDGEHVFSRMFIHRKSIEYRNHHYELWDNGSEINLEFPEYQYGYLIHKDITDETRIKQREEYYKIKNFDI